MKRIKPSRKDVTPAGRKLPDELVPIVDGVVEAVFERLRSAANPRAVAKTPLDRKTAKLNLPLPRQRTALAKALADLLLADLASRAGPKAKQRKTAPKKGSKRRTTAPKRRRSTG